MPKDNTSIVTITKSVMAQVIDPNSRAPMDCTSKKLCEDRAPSIPLFDSKGVMKDSRCLNGVEFRPLSSADFGRGFCTVLEELTRCEATEEDFGVVFREMKEKEGLYFVVVGEELSTGRIVASGTVFIERKFIHRGSFVGHIEDIVIKKEVRGKELGKELISHLVHIAESRGCYKVILDCNDSNVCFYEKCGFHKHENQMARYL